MSDAVLYQSVLQMGTTVPYQQLSNLALTGLSTNAQTLNSSNGKLYGTFKLVAGSYVLSLFQDVLRSQLVATATASTLPAPNTAVTQANGSNISGTVNMIQYQQDDDLIEAVALFSVDADMPMNYLTGLPAYDPVNGFAFYHIKAFEKIKEITTSRYKTKLYNPQLIDVRQINGGLGGFDLSRILDWKPLREASSQYALYLICEQQTVEPGSIWDKRKDQARNIFKGYVESVELSFDEQQKRIETSSRAFSTFVIGRA